MCRRSISVVMARLAFATYIIGRAGASPPSRTAAIIFLYIYISESTVVLSIQVNKFFGKLKGGYRDCIKTT